MKLVYRIIVVLSVLTAAISAQDYVFFSDVPVGTVYGPSSGFYNNNSAVVLTKGLLPLDYETKYSGLNSLRIRWKSQPGGDWGVSIGMAGWTLVDVTDKDSLIFRIFSYSDLDSAALPAVYLVDSHNISTPKKFLSQFTGELEKDTWKRISIPLSVLTQNSGNADLTKIKAVCFGQANADGSLRTIYLDEIRMISASDIDYTAPEIPSGLAADTQTVRIHLRWNSNGEEDLEGYRIYRSESEDLIIVGTALKTDTSFVDYVGIPPKTLTYRISAFDKSGNESALSDPVRVSTTSLPDSVLLDMVQRQTFKYFWDYAHPYSGLARERYGSGDVVTTGGSGFGIMSLIVGIERNFITRTQGAARMLKILGFLLNRAERFHGVFPHWFHGYTGKVIPFSEKDNGGDLVETAFMIQGLLAARQYFNADNSDETLIRDQITKIWEEVEWDWYRKDQGNFLYWHWSPTYGWEMNFPLQGPNETMIAYLLAIASPTHPIPASLYHSGWASSPNYKNGKSFYGIPLYVGWDYGGPLFFTHYSFLGFDPRGKKDAYTNYFINNRNHSLIHHAHAERNPKNFPGYDTDTWGLTASDDPIHGYLAHEINNDNGTIAPTAALSSMPYTPKESIDALKSFYYEYGSKLWGAYGFKDAFNLKEYWYANSYLAIDQGPIIVMIENYRTGLLWNNFMANPEIQPMLDAIGFVPDSTATVIFDQDNNLHDFKLYGNYPNPFNPSTTIEFSLSTIKQVSITVYDILGRQIRKLVDDRLSAGLHKVTWDAADNFGNKVSSGVYIYRITIPEQVLTGKMLLQK